MCGVATNVVCSSFFLYMLPLRGIRRFRHCFRRFGQQTNKKVTITVKTVTKTAKTVTRTANPLGVGVAAGMLVHEGHKALCQHSSASERLCATQLCAGGESSLGGISTYPVHQKALHHKKGVGQSFRTGPHPAGEAAATATTVAVAAASLGIAYHQPVFWRPAATPETVQRIR